MLGRTLMNLPYLTSDLPGAGGVIRQRPEDFFVQEVALYPPAGEGEHVLFEIQKINITTFDAIKQIARRLRVDQRDIGYAGLKDADALTRQHLTVAGVTEEQVMHAGDDKVQILWADRHRNKLRVGHLRANRFAIRIRNVDPTLVVRARPILNVLEQRGAPNYFGPQRFGRRGDNDALGLAILTKQFDQAIDLLLAMPNETCDPPDSLESRRLFAAGDPTAALSKLSRSSTEYRVLEKLIRTNSAERALSAIDGRLLSLLTSAVQSRVFNAVVARRLDTIDRLVEGDIAMKEINGACFAVQDVSVEQPRVDQFEISPTGPMPGEKMMQPAGVALQTEADAIAGLGLADVKLDLKGERRPLRIRPTETNLSAGIDEFGAHITVAFTLPAGAFATTLLREIMKSDLGSEA
jgi:tRNA pseudouridine13 synthase